MIQALTKPRQEGKYILVGLSRTQTHSVTGRHYSMVSIPGTLPDTGGCQRVLVWISSALICLSLFPAAEVKPWILMQSETAVGQVSDLDSLQAVLQPHCARPSHTGGTLCYLEIVLFSCQIPLSDNLNFFSPHSFNEKGGREVK